MKKFDGILICTDLDGTLIRNDRTISSENLDAIEYFKSEGGLFTFVTGRVPVSAKSIYETVRPNAPFGCINGGGIYDHRTQEYVWTQDLPEDALDLVEYVDVNMPGIGIQVNTFGPIYFSRENAAMQYFREITGVPNLVRHYREIGEPISKILFGDMEDENIFRVRELLNSHPRASEFDFIRSEKTLYELLPKGISKGSVLVRLAEHLGIDMRRTVAIGDYDNDVSMLRVAGVGIAVKNASPAAMAAADLVTVSNEEHAIARVISDIDNGVIDVK